MVKSIPSLYQLRAMAETSPDEALLELKSLIKTYPYFQAARVLELDLLRQLNHKNYKKALRQCALQTSFRVALFEHLENQGVLTQNIPKISNHSSDENSFLTWLEWVNTSTRESNPKKLDWIDDFLDTNPKIEPTKSTQNKDLAKDQSLATNEIMTETLANLYFQQKKYEEAKNAFKVLALKYPEKSSFFANQIKLIEAELASK